jgi:threonine/homoserine/homoserine lactone efflux protein
VNVAALIVLIVASAVLLLALLISGAAAYYLYMGWRSYQRHALDEREAAENSAPLSHAVLSVKRSSHRAHRGF